MDERKRTYQALSIVEPFGRFIAEGQKKWKSALGSLNHCHLKI